MLFYLNLVFAWISMIAAFTLTIIYFLRVLNKNKKIKWVARLNRALRKNHKSIGIILIIFGLIHGILSSDKVFSLNLGTVSWIVSVLLGPSFVYRKRFNPQRIWMSLHRILTIVFVATIVIHIVDVGGFAIDDVLLSAKAAPSSSENYETTENSPIPQLTSTPEVVVTLAPTQVPIASTTQINDTTANPTAEPTAEPTPSPTQEPQTKYIDGVYQGTADGFRPGLTVEVEIINDEIISVKVIDHNEVKERYWGTPVEYVPQWIVEAQSTNVDTVSGATYTSRGIIAATNEALSKALR